MELKYTLDERLERASELHPRGYNCAQCVAMVFDDVTPLDDEMLARATAAFGGGIGGTRGTCGCVTGMAAVSGLTGFVSPADKPVVYDRARLLVEDFSRSNGSVTCSELRQPGRKSCMELIREAVTILHNRLADEK